MTRRTRRCSPSISASGTSLVCVAWSTFATLTQRKRLLEERRQDLRRHPDRRRRVGARVPVTAVRAAELREERERLARRFRPGRDERLDHERCRLSIRFAARGEPEAAARRLKLSEVRE